MRGHRHRLHRLGAGATAHDLRVETRRRGAGDLRDGVHELLRRQPLGARAGVGVTVLVRVLADELRARLIRGGGRDEFERFLQVEFVLRELRREEVQQVVIPRLRLHRIGGMHDAAAHQAVPKAVHDRARETAVFRVRHQRRELLEPLGLRRGGVHLTEFGKEPARLRGLADGLVAAVNFHFARRVNRRESVSLLQLPTVNKTVVARRALEVDAEKTLADGLRELNLRRRARAHVAAPFDARREALALRRVGDQLARELVVGLVLDERAIEPLGDLLSPAGDKAGAGIIVAEQVVPKREPMLGVGGVIREQLAHEPRAFVRRRVAEKFPERLRLRQQAEEIKVRAARKRRVVNRRGRRCFTLRELGVEDAIDRIRAARNNRRQLGPPRLERRFVSGLLEREAVLPRHARINPRAQQFHFLRREARAFRRHLFVGIVARDRGDERRLRGIAGNDRLAALAARKQRHAVIHAETALLLVARVALGAVLAEKRHDLVREIHRAHARRADEQQRDGEARHTRAGPAGIAKTGNGEEESSHGKIVG